LALEGLSTGRNESQGVSGGFAAEVLLPLFGVVVVDPGLVIPDCPVFFFFQFAAFLLLLSFFSAVAHRFLQVIGYALIKRIDAEFMQ
jgi:hypothetical protein